MSDVNDSIVATARKSAPARRPPQLSKQRSAPTLNEVVDRFGPLREDMKRRKHTSAPPVERKKKRHATPERKMPRQTPAQHGEMESLEIITMGAKDFGLDIEKRGGLTCYVRLIAIARQK